MPFSQTFTVALALTRLRRAVLICCWLVGLSLGAQTVIWALATFTDVRFDDRAPEAPRTPTVVQRDSNRAPPVSTSIGLAPPTAGASSSSTDASAEQGQSRELSSLDHVFARAMKVAVSTGPVGMLALLALLAVGVVLAVSSSASGVDKTVSAFAWALMVAALALPLAGIFNLGGFEGAFTPYATLIRHVESARGDGPGANLVAGPSSTPAGPPAGLPTLPPTGAPTSVIQSQMGAPLLPRDGAAAAGRLTGAAIDAPPGPAMFYARFLLLPLTCIIGLATVGLRFSSGVEAAIIRTEYRLDPALEREAANIKASSLHSTGRSASALGGTIGPVPHRDPGPAQPGPAMASPEPPPPHAPASATRLSAGVAPKRII